MSSESEPSDGSSVRECLDVLNVHYQGCETCTDASRQNSAYRCVEGKRLRKALFQAVRAQNARWRPQEDSNLQPSD